MQTIIVKKDEKIKSDSPIKIGVSLRDHLRENIQFSSKLPLTDRLFEYLMNDIKAQNAESLCIYDKRGELVVHSLIFKYENTLYFGFFKTKDDDNNLIDEMIQNIEDEARRQNCTKIRGPINLLPTYFGWGFTEYDESGYIFPNSPVSAPNYIDRFYKAGFEVYKRVVHFAGDIDATVKPPKYETKFGDFKNMEQWADEYIKLYSELSTSEILLTPNRAALVNDLLYFQMEYGYEQFFVMAYNDSGKMVGQSFLLPNPIDLKNDETGKTKSAMIYWSGVHRDYWGSGVYASLAHATMEIFKKLGIERYEIVLNEDNGNSFKAARKYHNAKIIRKHLIFDKVL